MDESTIIAPQVHEDVMCLQHFLLSYRDALAEICRAQMNRKKRLEVCTCTVLTNVRRACISSLMLSPGVEPPPVFESIMALDRVP